MPFPMQKINLSLLKLMPMVKEGHSEQSTMSQDSPVSIYNMLSAEIVVWRCICSSKVVHCWWHSWAIWGWMRPWHPCIIVRDFEQVDLQYLTASLVLPYQVKYQTSSTTGDTYLELSYLQQCCPSECNIYGVSLHDTEVVDGRTNRKMSLCHSQ